jgi:glycosyltransferase involved in cell wall biosynthesis
MLTNSKILFVSHGVTLNGAELCLVEAIQALQRRGVSEVNVLLSKGGELERLLVANNVGIVYTAKNPRWIGPKMNFRTSMKFIRRTLQLFWQCSRTIRTLRPDYLISNSVVCSPATALAAKLHGIRHTWYVHELGDKDHGYKFYLGKKATWSLVKSLSHNIIFNSQFTRKHFENGNEQKHNQKVIYYAVPVDRFRTQMPHFDEAIQKKWENPKIWRILVAGRTSEGKGQEDVVRALAIVKNELNFDRFHLTILGKIPGAYSDKLASLVDKFGLHEVVKMIPFVSDPASYYAESHIGVTTSRNEAFGRITVEYMKAKLLVIGASSGATTEIIAHGTNGLLYKTGDIREFAELLYRSMMDFEGSASMSEKGKLAAEKAYNLDKYAKDLESVITMQQGQVQAVTT